MIKAMVVDDEVLTAEHICRLLTTLDVDVLGYYINPYGALEKVELLKPDVLFLDIEMPELSGLELAERIHANGGDYEVVFVTAYNQYAIEAFSVNALDYLLKPITLKDIERSVERVKSRRKEAHNLPCINCEHTVNVSLLGNLSLHVGDSLEQIRWITAKCAEVFAFMLLNRGEKEISKWKLVDAIWSDKDMEKADINLRSTISRLNKTLRESLTGVSVIFTGNGYNLHLKQVHLEVDAFQLEKLIVESVAISSENVDDYDNIIASYHGMLLEEFSSEWCETFRVKYHTYFIAAGKRLVKYYEELDTEPLKILNLIERMARYEPYDEEIRTSALKQHYRLGGRQSAEKYYRKYKSLLGNELGTEPGLFIKRVFDNLVEL